MNSANQTAGIVFEEVQVGLDELEGKPRSWWLRHLPTALIIVAVFMAVAWWQLNSQANMVESYRDTKLSTEKKVAHGGKWFVLDISDQSGYGNRSLSFSQGEKIGFQMPIDGNDKEMMAKFGHLKSGDYVELSIGEEPTYLLSPLNFTTNPGPQHFIEYKKVASPFEQASL